MKFDWNNWDIGGKVIFTASCIATASMLMKWVDVGIASQDGMAQGTFIFLGFWVYPLLTLLRGKEIHRIGGIVSAAASFVCAVAYMSSKSVTFFGQTVNAAGSGAYIFALASITLIFGVLKYKGTNAVSVASAPDAGGEPKL